MKLFTLFARMPPMWRIYVAGWALYSVVVSLVLQSDTLGTQGIRWVLLAQSLGSTVPAAALLALVWPLGGWTAARAIPAWGLVLIHICSALTFAIGSHVISMMLFGVQTRSIKWHAWPFMYSLMLYALVTGIFHSVRAGRTAQQQALAAQQARTLLVASELSALRNKLNPHFLFNTLHSIIALTQRNPAAAETALFQFSDMLRYVLDTERSGSDRVTLDAELDFVRDYLELESLRLGERLHVEWDLDADAGDHPLPALSLQPLVENSIKHAFNPHSRPGILQIRTRRDAATGALTMTVRDTGPGADPKTIALSPGLGLRTVERRLQLDYGSRAALRVQSAPGAGFSVSVTVPAARQESYA